MQEWENSNNQMSHYEQAFGDSWKEKLPEPGTRRENLLAEKTNCGKKTEISNNLWLNAKCCKNKAINSVLTYVGASLPGDGGSVAMVTQSASVQDKRQEDWKDTAMARSK